MSLLSEACCVKLCGVEGGQKQGGREGKREERERERESQKKGNFRDENGELW